MRAFASLAVVMSLAACNAETAPAGPAAGDPGTYTRMMPDGLLNTTVIQADGSYETVAGKTRATGQVRTEGEKTCFTGSDEGAVEACWTNGPIRPGGTFESTNGAGETYTITYSPEIMAGSSETDDLREQAQ